jgi:DNA-binding SARP family transcriptional activator/Tfp pilus assembly protein PilF
VWLVHFRLLGPVEIDVAGQTVPLPRRRERCLLGVLLLDMNRVVAMDRLAELLWDGDPPERARRAIHSHVSRLRVTLAPLGAGHAVELATVGDGYRIDGDPQTVDAHRFRTLLGKARQTTDLAERIDRQRAALDLWRGPPLANAASDWLRDRLCSDLQELHLAAVEDMAAASLALRRERAILPELAGTSRAHPGREELTGLYMRALYQAGRKVEALEAYDRTHRYLADTLGIDPGRALRETHLAILRDQLTVPLPPAPASATPPPAATVTAGPTRAVTPRQLPADVADFTGRATQLAQLDARLPTADSPATSVMVSAIDGTAGVGKTALAIHWAHRVADRFPDGQLYVNLRGYAIGRPLRPIEALSMLLRSLGLAPDQIPAEEAEASASYRTVLADRRVLVVLDNARSVDQVRPLLPASSRCLALVTSRDRLAGLVARDGARRISLDLLPPHEACALLTHLLDNERVEAAPHAVADLASGCAYLPLALRIAAAWLDSHPHRSLMALVSDLTTGNRLSTLELDGDQQSAVRATFDLSYRALPEPAQRLFRLLGLVPGADFAAEAASALTGMPLAATQRLLERLAVAHLLDQPAPGRYTFHDLLRLYARERAEQAEAGDDLAAALIRLLDWYLSNADAASRRLRPDGVRLPLPPDVPALTEAQLPSLHGALALMDAERANLIAAVEHAAEHGPQRYAWLLASRMREYLMRRVGVDGLTIGEAGLRAAERQGGAREQASSHIALADVNLFLNDHRHAARHYAHASELAGRCNWQQGQATAENNLALAYLEDGRIRDAAVHLARARDLNQQLGRLASRASNLGNLGWVRFLMGDLDQARTAWKDALVSFRQTGDRHREALSLANLGRVSTLLGELDSAQAYLARSLELRDEVGDRSWEAYARWSLARLLADRGRWAEAHREATEVFSAVRGGGEAAEEANIANTVAATHDAMGRHEEAMAHYRHALAVGQMKPHPRCESLLGMAIVEHRQGGSEEAAGRAREALETARRVGYRVVEGQALAILAEILAGQGRSDQARRLADQALASHRATGYRLGEARALAVLGGIALADGDRTAALQNWQAAQELFDRIGAPVPVEVTDGVGRTG